MITPLREATRCFAEHALGERGHRQSRALLRRLLKEGQIF
jgi:hypothetical protein